MFANNPASSFSWSTCQPHISVFMIGSDLGTLSLELLLRSAPDAWHCLDHDPMTGSSLDKLMASGRVPKDYAARWAQESLVTNGWPCPARARKRTRSVGSHLWTCMPPQPCNLGQALPHLSLAFASADNSR